MVQTAQDLLCDLCRKPFQPDNIQIVCRMANYAKADWAHEQMVEFCRAVRDNWMGR